MPPTSYIHNRRRSLPMNLHMNLTRSPPSTTSRPALRKRRPPTPRFPSLRATRKSPLAVTREDDIPAVPALSFWEPDTPSEQDEATNLGTGSGSGMETGFIYSPSVYGDTNSLSPEVVHGMGVLPSPGASAGLGVRRASVHVDGDGKIGFAYTWSPRFMFPRTPPVPPTKGGKGKNAEMEMEGQDGKRNSGMTTSSSSSSYSSPSGSRSNPGSSTTSSSAPSLSYSADTASTAPSSNPSALPSPTPNTDNTHLHDQPHKQNYGSGPSQPKQPLKPKRSIVDLRLNKAGGGAQHIGWSHSQSPVTLYFKTKEVEQKETIRERRWKGGFI